MQRVVWVAQLSSGREMCLNAIVHCASICHVGSQPISRSAFALFSSPCIFRTRVR